MSGAHKLVSKEILVGDVRWSVEAYDVFEKIVEGEAFQNEIKNLSLMVEKKAVARSFKWPLNAGSYQFLAGVIPGEKRVLVGSKNLSYELTLSDYYDSLHRGDEIAQIKKHAQSIAGLPLEQSPLVIDYIEASRGLPNLADEKFEEVHRLTLERSKELMEGVRSYKQSWFEKLSDKGLDLTANYMLIRIHLLKFLAILPCLDHDKDGREVKRNFVESLRRLIEDSRLAESKRLKGQMRALPKAYLRAAICVYHLAKAAPAAPLAWSIRKGVSLMATRFIAGEDIQKATGSLSALLNSGRDATLDQLGELVVSNKEADQYLKSVLEVVKGFNRHVKKGARNGAGINRAHVSVKVSALCNDLKPGAFEYCYQNIAPRLREILLAGKEEEVFINIDAEHYHYRDVIFRVYAKVLLETPELADYRDTGIVVQAYLRDGADHLEEVISLARQRGVRMPVRLVKGAYWDAETIEADALNFEAPEFLNKEETDIHFRQLVCKTLENSQWLQLALASHNIQDHCFARALRELKFPQAPAIEHQCLHMTYEALSVALSRMGFPTRNYIPVGNLLVGMAYLVRRIMENSSQVGVLTIMRSHNKAATLKSPLELLRHKAANRELVFDPAIKQISRDFKNVWPIRVYLEKELELFREAFEKEKSRLIPAQDAGAGLLTSLCPSDPSMQVGSVNKETPEGVDQKIQTLFEGFQKGEWADNRSSGRFAKLLKLADLLLVERARLAALIMLEAGKTIDEAIADVDEAIDFINFYVREEIALVKNSPGIAAKGVIGVVAPWNFPLAIPCGMTCSALAAGNSVILKPAEQTPIIISEFEKLARQAGIGADALAVAYGEGEIGKAIVEHPLINGVLFTGSKQVGVEIFHKMQERLTSSQYRFTPVAKTAITEMGGKNAVIVTNNCELDETVSGLLYAAFAHAGQKCSAASRILVDREIKDAFLERFIQAVKDLPAGSALEFSTSVNPLVSEDDQKRVREAARLAIEEARAKGGRVLVDRSQEEFNGYVVGPVAIEVGKETALDLDTFACKEIFGPVVHVIPYDGLDEAVEIFNATEYALTGGIYCQSQDDIDYLAPKLMAGNIYVNRPNTGARVAIEPFGGFKMSGTGPKAGSSAYLRPLHRQLNEQTREVFAADAQEDSEFLPARVSHLSWSTREAKVLEYLKTVINRYEIYFSGIDESGKDSLLSLVEYIEAGKARLDQREFPNRQIPGQINYDKRDLALGTGIFLLGEPQAQLDRFVAVVFNLLVGNGVNIVCASEESFKAWSALTKLAHVYGLSPYNINCSRLKKQTILERLKSEDYDFLCLDGALEDREEFRGEAFKSSNSGEQLRKTIILGDGAELEGFDQQVFRFTIPRSFAINTMRHGAPLELAL